MVTPSILMIPSQRLTSLKELLREYGPYRRDQLCQKLAKAAAYHRDEADHLRRSAERFPQASRLLKPTLSPEAHVDEADLLDAMAAFVAGFKPTTTFAHQR